jgi:hypothetical protein
LKELQGWMRTRSSSHQEGRGGEGWSLPGEAKGKDSSKTTCSNQHLVSGEIETPIPLIIKGVAEEDTDSSRG